MKADLMNAAAAAALALGLAGISTPALASEGANAAGVYTVECLDAEGNLRWSDTFDNLVTTAGKNDALDKYLAGSSYTAAWYLGLIGSTSYTTGPAAGDTSATHGGWVEDQSYSQSTRPTAAFSAASAGSKALSSAAAFTMNAGVTIKGCFLIANSTKGGTTGILYSAGLFTGGDKVVQSGDTLNVSYTASL
jgi:hypothetical protein